MVLAALPNMDNIIYVCLLLLILTIIFICLVGVIELAFIFLFLSKTMFTISIISSLWNKWAFFHVPTSFVMVTFVKSLRTWGPNFVLENDFKISGQHGQIVRKLEVCIILMKTISFWKLKSQKLRNWKGSFYFLFFPKKF